MIRLFAKNYTPNGSKLVVCNEGSSRSSKTFDTFHFLYTICDHNRNRKQPLDIYILRDTLTNCRDYTFKDFKTCMGIIGVNDEIEYRSEGQKPYANVYGNNVYFRGLDDEKNQEGYPSDILFFNESLEISTQSKIKGLRMRCRMMMIFDWNPKFTQHWCYKMEGQRNTFFTRSTFRDNKHLQRSVVEEIESYCPWHFDDMHIEDETKRRPHIYNNQCGTADKVRWKVYGEGIRCAPEGAIFRNIRTIEEFPDIAFIYGLDFGFVNDPTCLVKIAIEGKEIYLELLCYEPIERHELLDAALIKLGVYDDIPIIADSSDKYTGENKGTVEMVAALKDLGWSISKISKTKGIMYWITKMLDYRINIVVNTLYEHAQKESENYIWKEVAGIKINQPVDKFNHFWDAARYGFMSLENPDKPRQLYW